MQLPEYVAVDPSKLACLLGIIPTQSRVCQSSWYGTLSPPFLEKFHLCLQATSGTVQEGKGLQENSFSFFAVPQEGLICASLQVIHVGADVF